MKKITRERFEEVVSALCQTLQLLSAHAHVISQYPFIGLTFETSEELAPEEAAEAIANVSVEMTMATPVGAQVEKLLLQEEANYLVSLPPTTKPSAN